MRTDLDARYCAKHGWLSHAVVHEAGHAVIAVRRKIAFHEVSVHSPEAFVARADDFEVGGLSLVDTDLRAWVPARSADFLDVVLGGVLAEREIFDDTIPCSHVGDIEIWKRGMGWVGEVDPVQAERLIDESRKRVTPEIALLREAIQQVALELSAKVVTDSFGLYEDFVGSLVLASDEVAAIVNG